MMTSDPACTVRRNDTPATTSAITRAPRPAIRVVALLVLAAALSLRASAQAPYCLGGAIACDEHISRVTIAGIDHSSGCGNSMGYSNFSASVAPGTMTVGQSYTLTVENPVPYAADSVSMWIDWDMDDLFAIGSAEAYSVPTTDGGATFSLTFTCPSSIANGQRRLRIRINNSGISPFCFLPCGTLSSRGEVEDYTVTVTGGRTIDVTAVPSRLCTGTNFPIDFAIYGTYQPGNIFTAQLSNPSGGFGAPVDIGSLPGTASGTISAMLTGVVAPGTGYRVRIIASNPPTVGNDNGSDITVLPGYPFVLTWTGAVDSLWTNPGNWDNPCAIPTTGDTVYIPSSVRPPTGIPAISLAKLRLDNAAGLRLTSSLLITRELELAEGCIILGASSLGLTSAASIIAAGASAFVVTNGAGDLRQAGIGPGLRTGTVLFPVGSDAASYTPATVENLGMADEYRIRVSDSIRTGGVTGNAVRTNAVNRTWHVSEATAGASAVTLRLQWDARDELSDFHRSACFISRFDGAAWIPQHAAAPADGADPYSIVCSGITAFSPFVVADSLSLVPVDLVEYFIACVDGRARVAWSTADERHNAGFAVERRARRNDGWARAGFVPAHPAGGGRYSFVDEHSMPGAWQYRLVQIDHDGTRAEYPPLDVTVDTAPQRLALAQNYPNPASASTTIAFTLPGACHTRLAVTDLLGREVALLLDAEIDAGGHELSLDAALLVRGAYRVSLTANGESVSRVMTVTGR